MTKAEYRRAVRLSPIGDDGVTKIREIAGGHQAEKVNEVMVDAFSAGWFINVYDALSEENRAKLRALCIGSAMDIVWRMAERGGR